MKVKTLIFSIVFVVAAAIFWWWRQEIPLVAPITQASVFEFLTNKPQPTTSGKVVYGFLPYWNVGKTVLRPELTHLSYFSLGISADGRLGTQTEEGTIAQLQSESLLELMGTMTATQRNVELVVTQFDDAGIEQFLASDAAQERFMRDLDAVLLAYPFTGVNIDIEYNGSPPPQVRQNLTRFMQRLNQHLDATFSKVTISIDMYASAPTSRQIWDVEALGKEVDYIVVMAYDFHRRSSPQAGPVAPLFGGKELWQTDISRQLKEFLAVVPSQKILLGVPFYGYEWRTDSRDAQANTYPETGRTASYTRVQELLRRKQELNVEEHWHEAALSPYLIYEENDETYILYYENSRSLAYKFDFVNQLDLGGIAIWALGYEGEYQELWDVIKEKLDTASS